MGSPNDAFLKALGEKSNVRRVPGFFRGMDGNRAVVDFGGGRVPADMAMDGIPPVNEPVWILLIDNRDPLVLGYSVPKPGIGTVVAVDGNIATVDTVFGNIPVGMLAIVNVDDVVLLTWNERGGTILGPWVSPSDPGVDPGAPGGGVKEYFPEFTAVQSGSWRGGRYWTPQVRAGDTNQGVYVYGTKIPDTIPSNASIKSVEIYISPASLAGSTPNFALHSLGSLSGAPSFGPQAAIGVGGTGWLPLPTSWGDLLKRGGGYLGVGVNHGGNSIFNPAGTGQAGNIRIRYTA